jgi:hypothetical protein
MAGFVILRTGLMALLAAGYTVAGAQSLPDPTRPPSAFAGVAGGGSASGMDSAAPAAAGPLLQSVIMRQGAKARALISGEWFEQGQTRGDSRLVKIAADRVEMRGPQGREILKLTPDVEKKLVTDRSGKKTQGTK